MGMAKRVKGAGTQFSFAELAEVAQVIGTQDGAVWPRADEVAFGVVFAVFEFIGGLPGFFGFENFIKFLAERNGADGVLAFWDGLNFSGADDGRVDIDFPIIHVYVLPCEGEAFAEAHAGMVSESYRHIELMAGWEFFKDCGELGGVEDSGFFGSLVVVRDLDDGSGVGAKVVVHVFCPREGFFEDGTEGDKSAVTVFFFPGI